jgi:hydrogenase-4 component E|uniref:Hydrogenase 4 membrane component (E)-like protein n=1 Tax=Mesoaciditoga lauensis TaxID=1495039 RepID=A0A7V3RF86_9BACT
MKDFFMLIGFSEILLVIFMQWEVYVTKIVKTFSVSSYLIALFLFYLSFIQHSYIVLVLAILTAVIRGFFIPYFILKRLSRDPWRERESTPITGTASSIIISLMIGIFTYVLYEATMSSFVTISLGALPIALIFQGAFLVISRRSAFIQLVGYMVMENAAFLFTGYLFPDLPFSVEAGTVLDLIGIVMISGVIMRMRENSAKKSDDFDELRG